MNLTSVKLANRNAVFNLIYKSKSISKIEIANKLNLSLPTVSQYVNELKTTSLISDNQFFESTGGRKAAMVSFVEDYKIAIGVDIQKDSVHLVALNLLGECFRESSQNLKFMNNNDYCVLLSNLIMNFFLELNVARETLLGVGIAIQGLVDKSGQSVFFGDIMDADQFSISMLHRYIPFKCILRHDSEASASYMLWKDKNLKEAFYLILNRYFGGVLIDNGKIHWGKSMPSGLVAHMTLKSNGKKCYCGKRGCVDAYCSARILEEDAGMPLSQFFSCVRNNEEYFVKLWHNYLDDLAATIYNLQIVTSIDVILGGTIAKFMISDDVNYLKSKVKKDTNISKEFPDIFIFSDTSSAAKGAALFYIESFIDNFKKS